MGGTASRFCLIDAEGAVVRRGTATGATGHMFNPDARAAFERSVDAMATAVPEPLAGLVIGMTGYGPRAEADIAEVITARLQVEPTTIFASDDIELAFRTLFSPGHGHLISAGTGSIAVHLSKDERLLRLGGRGTLIDDAGSGTWIALAALRALYRRIDEAGSPGDMEILAEKLFEAMGGSDWSDTRSFVYGGDRGRIARFPRQWPMPPAPATPSPVNFSKRRGRNWLASVIFSLHAAAIIPLPLSAACLSFRR